MILSTVFVTEVLGLVELKVNQLVTRPLAGFSLKELNFVTTDIPKGFFCKEVEEAVKEYGYFLFFSKETQTRVPLKYYLPEEQVTADTFRQAAARQNHNAQQIDYEETDEGFVAVAVVDGQRFVGTGNSSVIAAEEATKKLVDVAMDAPTLQMFRRTVGGDSTHEDITATPHISARYVLGVTLNIPRDQWNRVLTTVNPVSDSGDRVTHSCGMFKHVSGACNVKTYKDGKTVNPAVPGRYRTFLSFAISFGLCKGPKCGMHTPQVYELEIFIGSRVHRACFSVSNHQNTRGDLALFERTRNLVHARVLRAKLIAPPEMEEPVEPTVQIKTGSKLRKTLNRNSDEQEKLEASLDGRRRFSAQGKELVTVNTSPIAPSMVLVQTSDVPTLLNYVRLHCAGAYGYSDTNIGVRLLYLSMAQAMGDSIKLSQSGFEVTHTSFLGSEEFLIMCSAGHVFDRRGGAEVSLKAAPDMPEIIVPGFMCCCVGQCTQACVAKNKDKY